MMVKKKVNEPEDHEENKHTRASENTMDDQAASGENEALKEVVPEGEAGGDGPDNVTASVPEDDRLSREQKVLEEKAAELQDKYLRLSAEFDNYRKRTLREKMEISKYAGEELLKNLLPLADDFDRALKHMEGSTDCKGLKEGIDLIYCKFGEFLRQNGIREIDSMDSDFNVDVHDAVAKIPVESDEKRGKVVEILQKGYYLKDKVIRHSKVVVGE